MQQKTIAILRSNPKDAALSRLIRSLSKIGRVDCYVWDRQRDFQPAVTGADIRYLQCRLRAGFYSAGTLLKLLLFQTWLFARLLFSRCEVVHAIDLDTGLPGYFAARLTGKKFVYHCLDPYYAILPKGWPAFLARWARWLENTLVTRADLFIITDQWRMPQHNGARPRRVVELANVPTLPDDLPAPARSESFTVGYLGSLIEGRNLFTAIEACGELKTQGVQLVIGGFGPLEKEIQRQAQHWPNVRFRAWLPYSEMLREEAGFDLLFHITDPDNEAQKWVSPNKLFEAMALGTPIIVGRGTLAARRVEIIGNGVAVAYGTKIEFQEAILRFKSDPSLCEQTGRRGLAEFQRNWRPETVEKKLLSAYKDILHPPVAEERQ